MNTTIKKLARKAVVTKYHGPSNVRGSRYSATDGDGNRVIVGALDNLNSEDNHKRAALALCEKMGWDGTLVGGYLHKNSCVFVWA